MPETLHGVIIVDVVKSRQTAGFRSLLTKKLRNASSSQIRGMLIRARYVVTARDEFQTVASQLVEIPTLVFDLRRRLRPLDLRIGIGIGEISEPIREPVNRVGGQAFEHARQALDRIKKGRRHKFERLTAFRSTDRSFDFIANGFYGLQDTLLKNISEKQWETIDVYADKASVKATARALRVNESTVSRNLKRGYYWQMEEARKIVRESIRTHFL